VAAAVFRRPGPLEIGPNARQRQANLDPKAAMPTHGWRKNPNWVRDGLSSLAGLWLGCAFGVATLRFGYHVPMWALGAILIATILVFEAVVSRWPLWLVIFVATVTGLLLVFVQAIPQHVRLRTLLRFPAAVARCEALAFVFTTEQILPREGC
jgi:hypothetical protein